MEIMRHLPIQQTTNFNNDVLRVSFTDLMSFDVIDFNYLVRYELFVLKCIFKFTIAHCIKITGLLYVNFFEKEYKKF